MKIFSDIYEGELIISDDHQIVTFPHLARGAIPNSNHFYRTAMIIMLVGVFLTLKSGSYTALFILAPIALIHVYYGYTKSKDNEVTWHIRLNQTEIIENYYGWKRSIAWKDVVKLSYHMESNLFGLLSAQPVLILEKRVGKKKKLVLLYLNDNSREKFREYLRTLANKHGFQLKIDMPRITPIELEQL